MKKAIIFVTLLCGIGAGLFQTGSRADDRLLEKGRKVYQANCRLCHGQDGRGDGPAAAVLNPKPTDYTQPAFWTGNTEAKIAASIKHGKGQMPAIELDDFSVKAVIYYIEQVFKPGAARHHD